MVEGVGINDADYPTQRFELVQPLERYPNGKLKLKCVWVCPFYRKWRGILTRCYSKKFLSVNPAYLGCSVEDEWLLFSNFKNWMMCQDWDGLHLDKDLLVFGNKVYGKDTCIFIPKNINSFISEKRSISKSLVGASWNKDKGKYVAQCQNPFSGKYEHLGYFESELEAHKAWLSRKIEHANALAASQLNNRIATALINYYENYPKP